MRTFVFLPTLVLLIACSSDDTTGSSSPSGADVPAQDVHQADSNVETDAGGLPDIAVETDSAVPDTEAPDVTPTDTGKTDIGEPDAGEADAGSDTQTSLPGEIDLTIGDWQMQPGEETTRCVLKRLPTTEAVTIKEIRTKLAPGSHHLIVYRSTAVQEQLTPEPCAPFMDTFAGGAPLIITEIPEETLTFPKGVGIDMPAGQMIRIEAHYLNYFPEEITAHADVTFVLAEPGEIQEKADFLFYGTANFNLPPNSPAETAWTYMDVPNGAKVFGLTGHVHAMGTLVEVEHSSGGAQGTPIYPLDEPFSWDEAPVLTYDPPLEFPSGDGFRFRCKWVNTSNSNIGFGQSASSEMCFIWAYYYPSQGFRLCAKGLPLGSCSDDG